MSLLVKLFPSDEDLFTRCNILRKMSDIHHEHISVLENTVRVCTAGEKRELRGLVASTDSQARKAPNDQVQMSTEGTLI